MSVRRRCADLPARCRPRRPVERAGRILAPLVGRGVLAGLVAVAATGVPGATRASSPSISFLADQLRVGEVARIRLSGVTPKLFGHTWYRSSDKTDWSTIKFPGTQVDYYGGYYTPAAADLGKYLRVVFTNKPANGPKQTLEVVSAAVVGQQAAAPRLEVTEFASGLSIPWDLAFAPDGSLLFTERGGALKVRRTDGSIASVAADLSDLWAEGNAGLKSIVVDPAFSSNRRFYTCQAHKDPKEIQVVAWTIDAAYGAATRVKDPLVGGIPRNDLGGHAGCRLRFGPGDYLYVSTGDGGGAGDPQSSSYLGGKVLRVDRFTGAAAPGKSRILSYGHRNPQGLARRASGQMWSVEHGPAMDDEINLLVAGGNFGWNPYTAGGDPSYDDSGPMTDLAAFPAALEAKWSSGTNTVANSGAVFLDGGSWGSWEGRLAVATLAQRDLRVIEFTSAGAFVSEIEPGALRNTYGRLRTPVIGPDKALYLTTSNSTDESPNVDKILRVVPHWTPPLVLEPPEATFGSASSTAGEAEGTHEVIVNLSPAPVSNVAVQYTIGGTASTPGDYAISGMGELSVPAGAPTAAIEVALVDDGAHESDETVVLTLGSGDGYAVGLLSTHTLTIESDDSASSPPGGSPPPPNPDPDPPPPPPPDPPPPSGPPEARIAIDGADCGTDFCVAVTGAPVLFRDASTGAVFSRSWDAGDGSRPSRSSSFAHTWSVPGYYVVSLRVSGAGAVSEATRTILVRPAERDGTCEPDVATLCLRDERFSVSVEWFDGDGASGRARVVYVGTNDSGVFRFFDPANWEVLAKVLDGCSINGHVWVLAASTTDLGYRILVTDTATGETKEYANEAGRPSPSIVDVKAFGGACGA